MEECVLIDGVVVALRQGGHYSHHSDVVLLSDDLQRVEEKTGAGDGIVSTRGQQEFRNSFHLQDRRKSCVSSTSSLIVFSLLHVKKCCTIGSEIIICQRSTPVEQLRPEV